MIENAMILRIDRKTGVSPAGRPIFTGGDDIAVRCFADSVTDAQRLTLGATLDNASSVLYVPKTPILAAGEDPPALGCRILIAIDQDDPDGTLNEVVMVNNRQLGTIAHWEVFLQKV